MFRALVNIPKEQLKGDGKESAKRIMVGGQPITMERPAYETEAAVTKAIANGTFKGSSQTAYKLAADWQKQLAAAEPKTIKIKKAAPQQNSAHTLSRYTF